MAIRLDGSTTSWNANCTTTLQNSALSGLRAKSSCSDCQGDSCTCGNDPAGISQSGYADLMKLLDEIRHTLTGHRIVAHDDAIMAQMNFLQFLNCEVTNDSALNTTIVRAIGEPVNAFFGSF